MGNYVYARDDSAARYVVRGKVIDVGAYFWSDNRLIKAKDIPERLWPTQINNMTMWYGLALKALDDTLLDRVHHMLIDPDHPGIVRLEYLVNDGDGAKSGKGANENKFTYRLLLTEEEEEELRVSGLRIDIVIKTTPHALLSQKRVKERKAAEAKLLADGADQRGGADENAGYNSSVRSSKGVFYSSVRDGQPKRQKRDEF